VVYLGIPGLAKPAFTYTYDVKKAKELMKAGRLGRASASNELFNFDLRAANAALADE